MLPKVRSILITEMMKQVLRFIGWSCEETRKLGGELCATSRLKYIIFCCRIEMLSCRNRKLPHSENDGCHSMCLVYCRL
jgi:hypothetical protein